MLWWILSCQYHHYQHHHDDNSHHSGWGIDSVESWPCLVILSQLSIVVVVAVVGVTGDEATWKSMGKSL